MTFKQSDDALRSQLRDQILFLRNSAKAYDEGYLNEAKRIATVIRILVYDKNKSPSLLTQLGKKDIKFYDTADKHDGGQIPTPILVFLCCHGAEPTRYLPRLTNSHAKKVDFNSWWEGVAIDDKKGNILTRKELILNMCNKDGGAHVDPKLDDTYAAISKLNSVGWKFVSSEGKEQDIMGIELASVRQICYEILKSLESEFPEYFRRLDSIMEEKVKEKLLKIVTEYLESKNKDLESAVNLATSFSLKNSINPDSLLELSCSCGSNESYYLAYIFAKTCAVLSTVNIKRANAHFNAGLASFFMGWKEEAEKQYQLALEIYPKNVIVLTSYGNLLSEMGRKEEAEKQYQLALENDPKNVNTHCNYGSLLDDMGRKEEAEIQYLLALENDPSDATTHYNYGNLMRNMGRKEEAEIQYLLALEIDPKNVITHLNYGNLMYKMGRKEEAEEHYKLALKTDPKNVNTHCNYGNLMRNMGRKEEAEKQYQLALENDPKNVNTHCNYGSLLDDMDRKEEAEIQYLLALENDPKNVNTHSSYGLLLDDMGRKEEAEEHYKFALENDPQHVITLNNLGSLLSDMNRFEEAKQMYEKALEMGEKLLQEDPENVFYQLDIGMTLNNFGSSLWNVGHIEEAKQMYQNALEIYEKLLKKDPENMTYQSSVGMTRNNLSSLRDLLINTKFIEEAGNSNQRKTNHIFLSYAHEDKEIAQKIVSKLAERGINLFCNLYELNIEDSLYNSLKAAISANDYLIILLSPNSINSKWVQKELENFLGYDLANRDITFLPILIAYCEIPQFLANYQYFDFRNNQNENIEKLIDQIYQALEIDFSKLNFNSFENLVYDLIKELKFIDIERNPKYFGRRPDFKAKYKYFDPFEREVTETWIVEVKFYRDRRADVREITQLGNFLANCKEQVRGLLITNSQITSDAKNSIKHFKDNGINIRIIDSTEIKLLLLKHNKLIKNYFSDSKVIK